MCRTVDLGMVPPADKPTFSNFFTGGVTYDGRRYVYLAPARASEGPMVRLDTRGGFRDFASWEAVDLAHHSSAVDTTSWTMFGGLVSDGRHLYTVPNDYLAGSVFEQMLPTNMQNDYIGALFRIDPRTATPAFELEVAAGGAGGGPGAGRGVGVVWSVAAGGGVATVSTGDLLTAGVHVIVASYSPQLTASGSTQLSLFVDGTLASVTSTLLYSRTMLDPTAVTCDWLDADSTCDQEWGGCSAGVDAADCAGPGGSPDALEYGGGGACAPDSSFWDGDMVDMRVWGREVAAAEAATLTAMWLQHGVAPPALPPPPPPPPPPEPAAAPTDPDTVVTNPGTGGTPTVGNTGGTGGATDDGGGDDGAGGMAMLIPVVLVGGVISGIGAYCVMKSCSSRDKKKSVSPYGADDDPGAAEKEDGDFKDVMQKVEAAIAEGADGGGVQGVEQWSVTALKRWLTRVGVPHTDAYERSELIGRVLSKWLSMTKGEQDAAAEAARKENNNEGGSWWRAGEAAGVNGAAGGPDGTSDTPERVSQAQSKKNAFDAAADDWFRKNGPGAREGRSPPPNGRPDVPGSYAENSAKEKEARAEREARDKVQQQQEDAEAWKREKTRRQETAAEREMAAQAAAAEGAAKRRQEAEWTRQKEAQKNRDSGQTAREAELQRQKEQYQRELERRMAMERGEAQQKAQNAAQAQNRARADAKRKEEEKLREVVAQREREAARKKRAAAAQQAASGGFSANASSNAGYSGGGSGGGGGGYDDGIRTSGGQRVDPELQRKQNDRVRELRKAEAQKVQDADDMASVQKRVDHEVDRWAQVWLAFSPLFIMFRLAFSVAFLDSLSVKRGAE